MQRVQVGDAGSGAKVPRSAGEPAAPAGEAVYARPIPAGVSGPKIEQTSVQRRSTRSPEVLSQHDSRSTEIERENGAKTGGSSLHYPSVRLGRLVVLLLLYCCRRRTTQRTWRPRIAGCCRDRSRRFRGSSATSQRAGNASGTPLERHAASVGGEAKRSSQLRAGPVRPSSGDAAIWARPCSAALNIGTPGHALGTPWERLA